MNQIQKATQKAVQERWIATLKQENGYWMHDGNLNRPYALLTSGRISNFYANCSVITRNPRLLSNAVEDLLEIFAAVLPPPDAFVGSAYGAITLAYELARQKEAEAWFTSKKEDGTMVLDRFDFHNGTTNIMLVEDAITTFTTTRASLAAVKAKTEDKGGHVLPHVFALVNGSGRSEIDGFQIISLIEVPTARNWDSGHNPFLGDQPERVAPLRPKQNWATLMRDYPR